MTSANGTITYLDTTLRDGSHAIDHQMTTDMCRDVVGGLSKARVRFIEVGHGAGLGGSCLLQGLAKVHNLDLFDAAQEVIGDSVLTTMFIPGVGVKDELREAVDHGIGAVRVTTHVTEADVGIQHLDLAQELGLRTLGFLMMTHMAESQVVAEQAKIMADSGAEVVYLADSAGYMTDDDIRSHVSAVRDAVDCDIGIHAHNNLGLAISNSVASIEEGATWIDGSLGGLGAGAGNTPGEVLTVVLKRQAYDVDLDEHVLMDVAEEVVRPVMEFPQIIDRTSLVLGYAGVYSSFLHKAWEVGDKYGVEPRDLLLEAGRRRAVGGQEDLLEEIAVEWTTQSDEQVEGAQE